jgi:hypothetical protein
VPSPFSFTGILQTQKSSSTGQDIYLGRPWMSFLENEHLLMKSKAMSYPIHFKTGGILDNLSKKLHCTIFHHDDKLNHYKLPSSFYLSPVLLAFEWTINGSSLSTICTLKRKLLYAARTPVCRLYLKKNIFYFLT